MWVTIVTQLVSFIVGFAGQYLPDWLKVNQENKQEEKMVALQLQLEKEKNKAAGEQALMSRETAEILQSLQGELAEQTALIQDRVSAREYGKKAMSMMDQTLARGKELNVPQWVISWGWCVVLLIEALSASVQPMIAVCVFAIWMSCKIMSGWWWFELEDWMLLDAVIGFFLGGRVKKLEQARRAS